MIGPFRRILIGGVALGAALTFVGHATIKSIWGYSTHQSSVQMTQMPPAMKLTLPSSSTFGSIASRPLFTPTRRPFKPQEKQKQPDLIATRPPAPIPIADGLIAVVIGRGRSIAILHLQSGKSAVVLEGQDVQGWKVTTIAEDHVLLTQASYETVLQFRHQGRSLRSSVDVPVSARAQPLLRRR